MLILLLLEAPEQYCKRGIFYGVEIFVHADNTKIKSHKYIFAKLIFALFQCRSYCNVYICVVGCRGSLWLLALMYFLLREIKNTQNVTKLCKREKLIVQKFPLLQY